LALVDERFRRRIYVTLFVKPHFLHDDKYTDEPPL
jgi:hypothetical protein